MSAAVALICFALLQTAADPVELLKRIRVKMTEVLEHLPDYTCRQTIERSVRHPGFDKFVSSDTLHFEVSYVGGREMFARPGADRFEEKTLSEMVGGGAIGTGTFALHAKAVFAGDSALFTYAGETVEDGRIGIQFDFRVPRAKSTFQIRANGGTPVTVGYRGQFRVDAGTLDLIRLQVDVDDLPSGFPIVGTGETMEYRRIPIGHTAFLLPYSSRLIVRDAAGMESRNVTTFDGCRQYTGESVIRFAEQSEQPADPIRR